MNMNEWLNEWTTDISVVTILIHDRDERHQPIVFKKKLKPGKFFMGKPSQNYRVPPKYGAHNFTCSPT